MMTKEPWVFMGEIFCLIQTPLMVEQGWNVSRFYRHNLLIMMVPCEPNLAKTWWMLHPPVNDNIPCALS